MTGLPDADDVDAVEHDAVEQHASGPATERAAVDRAAVDRAGEAPAARPRPAAVDMDTAHRWVEAYSRAWEARDPDAAAALFAEDAAYWPTPFTPPLRGRQAIRAYWAEQTGDQAEIRFRFSILGLGAHRAVAHGRTEYTRASTGTPMVLDGVIEVGFGPDERCAALRAWWQQRERRPRPADG